jgi:hypothetical protein
MLYVGGKVQYPLYKRERKKERKKEMKYLHGNLEMHIICGWQNAILAL